MTAAIDCGRRSAVEVDQPGRSARRATWFRIAVGTPHPRDGRRRARRDLHRHPGAGDARERAKRAVTWFVAFAPTVPIAAAVIAYATAADPAGNTGAATPLHSFRLVVLRTAILLAAVLPVGLLASVLLPVPTSLVLGWFLPAVAVCAIVLAVGSRYDPRWVAASLAVGWAAVVLGGFARLRALPLTEALEQLSVNQPGRADRQCHRRRRGGRLVRRLSQRCHLSGVVMSIVSTTALTRRFGGVAAVDSLDLDVNGGVVGLLGPNGSGKTTLLRMLATVLSPTSGDVSIFGLDPSRSSRAHRHPTPARLPATGTRLLSRILGVRSRRLRRRVEGDVGALGAYRRGSSRARPPSTSPM